MLLLSNQVLGIFSHAHKGPLFVSKSNVVDVKGPYCTYFHYDCAMMNVEF
jgi:hypothetical protein